MYAFSFFREFAPAFHLAISDDLIHWQELNDEEPILESNVGVKYWRDPFVIRGQDGVFHLLCTDGWESPNIIHASSENLMDWSEQDVLPVMKAFPSAKNAWAPEACYDHETGKYWIFWSSTVEDAFPDHEDKPKDYRNHRIYACTTRDFRSFEPTHLFFDPGYNCIDASIGFNGLHYLMAFKDERGENNYSPEETARKHILIATAPTPQGPWDIKADPISESSYTSGTSNPKETWAEGPCVFWDDIRQEWWVYFEYFRSHTYGAAKSRDGIHWTRVIEKLQFPPGVKHGTVFQVDDSGIIAGLRALVR